jgi:hypothetical protein
MEQAIIDFLKYAILVYFTYYACMGLLIAGTVYACVKMLKSIFSSQG